MSDEQCRRCGALLAVARPPADAVAPERTAGQRALAIAGLIVTLLVLAYSSLIVSSAGLTDDQRRSVDEAMVVLERGGFATEAAALGIVSFRSTDSWWNRYVGHSSAYASTNFPFAVVTLYPPFFDLAVDETERAMILLHEAHHVFGAGEEAALRQVWLEKERLGWTSERYGDTRVWRNTREWTAKSAPELFN